VHTIDCTGDPLIRRAPNRQAAASPTVVPVVKETRCVANMERTADGALPELVRS
jgi:hypothetical protein